MIMRDALFWEKAIDGAIITDQSGHILWANPAAATIFGWESPRDIMQMRITALVSEDEKVEAEDDLDALRENQHVYRMCRFLDRRGKPFDTTLEAVRIEGDCFFLTVRNPRINPSVAVTQDTPAIPTDYMPKAVRKALATHHDEGPGIHVTQKGRIRLYNDGDTQSDSLLPFTRRILKEFDRLRESISSVAQNVTRIQTLQETTMRDQERLEDRITRLEAKRPDCASCRTSTTVELLRARVDDQDLQIRRVEDRLERQREWADGRLERSREVPLVDYKMEKLADQNMQSWVFLKSKWAYLAGAIGMLGLIGTIIGLIVALT